MFGNGMLVFKTFCTRKCCLVKTTEQFDTDVEYFSIWDVNENRYCYQMLLFNAFLFIDCKISATLFNALLFID